MLYISVTYLFYNYMFLPFYPFHLPAPPPPTSGNLQSVLCACEAFCFVFRFHIKVRSYSIFFLWLISVSIMPSRFIHVVTNSRLPLVFSSVRFSSIAKSCPTLCDPMDCSTPGLPVRHQLLKLAGTHAHRVGDAIQLPRPLSPSGFVAE